MSYRHQNPTRTALIQALTNRPPRVSVVGVDAAIADETIHHVRHLLVVLDVAVYMACEAEEP